MRSHTDNLRNRLARAIRLKKTTEDAAAERAKVSRSTIWRFLHANAEPKYGLGKDIERMLEQDCD